MAYCKHWCFTLHADEEEASLWAVSSDPPLNVFDDEVIEYMVYQVERAPETGQVHLQGFLSLKKKQRMLSVKRILGRDSVHLEKTQGRPDQAAEYCKKPETRIAGPWEWGKKPDGRGHKSPTAIAIEAIQYGKPLQQVAVENPLAWVRSYKGLTAFSQVLTKPNEVWRVVTVIVLYGPTRSGKTRAAMSSTCVDGRHPYQMPLSSGFWFDGYEGEDTLVIDDFYGQLRFSDMLRILDGHYVQVPVKGGFTWAKWTKVYITSNTHPDLWWQGTRESIPHSALDAMRARFTEIVHMPNLDSDPVDPNLV